MSEPCQWAWRYAAGQCCGEAPCKYGEPQPHPLAAELTALRAENARLREALDAILSPDHLLNASPEVFGGYAARRMQAQAHAALHPKEETP